MIAVDGAIVAAENFANILLDIAVLRSLNIRVVVVHGAAHQVQQLAESTGVQISDLDGSGRTDEATLELAMDAGNRVAHEILEGFAAHDLRAAVTNAIKSLPVGIIKGVDQERTGRVESIDVNLMTALLERGVIPVVPPLGFDGNGGTYRINSDGVAVRVAHALRAVKLIYLTSGDGILRGDSELIREIPSADLKRELEKVPSDLTNLSKAKHAVAACDTGVPRVHVINGRTNEGLLTEVFSNEGIGTLVYANDYHQIRSAGKGDVGLLVQLTKDAVLADELFARSRQELLDRLQDYYILEIDRHVIGCVALHLYPDEHKAELAYLCVSKSHQRQGIGRRLVQFAEDRARQAGVETLFLLSTQSFTYFQNEAGFVAGSAEMLPESRRQGLASSGRNSVILVKSLADVPKSSLRSGGRN